MLACAIMPAVALAHAALNGSTPADGSVTATAPAQFELMFSEPVSPLALRLIGPDGAAITLDRFALNDKTLVITPPDGLTHGTYALSWRVVSEDGHPVGGTLVFSIGSASLTVPSIIEQSDEGVQWLIWLSRLGLYCGLFIGCGAAAFRTWVGPLTAPARRFAATMTLLGLLCLPVALGMQGLDAMGAQLGAVLSPSVWKAAAATSYIWTIAGAALALSVALFGIQARGPAASAAGVLGTVLAGIALASSGHAGSAHPQWLMRPAVFLHAAAIALWVGSLLPLAGLLRTEAGRSALGRFSSGIVVIVCGLLLSGLVLAFVQVETPDALLGTNYGRVLLAKLTLVAVALSLAAFNRWRLTRRAVAGDRLASETMARVVGVELGVLLVVFGVAALWRFTPPPRAIAVAQAMPASTHIHTLEAMADIRVTPGRAGPVTIEIVLMNGEFGPLPAKEVTVGLSNRAAGIEPIERKATLGPDGLWRVDALTLPVAGRWAVDLAILISDFEMRRINDAIDIRP